jgi:transcriptional regulator with XRE-family HTH domain
MGPKPNALMGADPDALLAVLLARTGLSQTDAAALLGVAGRTVRRWIEGVGAPPAVAIDQLKALVRTLDMEANGAVQAMDRARPRPAVQLVYRRDQDVPPWINLLSKHRCDPEIGRRDAC